MAFDINPNMNLIAAMQKQQPISQAKAVGQSFEQATGGNTSSKSNNPFGGNYVGINQNIGVGDSSFIAAQAGKQAGVGKTIGIA